MLKKSSRFLEVWSPIVCVFSILLPERSGSFFYSDAELKARAIIGDVLTSSFAWIGLVAFASRGALAGSSLPGGENRWHLEMLVDGEKPQAECKKQSNPPSDPDRREHVAQQYIERAPQQ